MVHVIALLHKYKRECSVFHPHNQKGDLQQCGDAYQICLHFLKEATYFLARMEAVQLQKIMCFKKIQEEVQGALG